MSTSAFGQSSPRCRRTPMSNLGLRTFRAAALGILLANLPGVAEADRGRPTVVTHPQFIGTTYATFVSDNGSLLRGPRWSTDINGCQLPQRSQITSLRGLGFNALHLYAESFNEGYPAGTCRTAVETLVNWTGQDGLYLVLTIGNGLANGSYDYTFAWNFWNLYAPLFKNRTHVIYEIQNEPFFNFATFSAQPSPPHLITFERDMYNLIRSKAPNTPILLFSYAVFRSGQGVMQDVQALGSTVNWSNAAIAFHGYAPTLAETEATLNTVVGNRIPVMQTEFIQDAGYTQHVPQTILYEDRFTSWLSFLDVQAALNPNKYKNLLDQASVVWAADFGTWPATLAPPPAGSTISLRALVNNRWVSAPNASTPLRANQTSVNIPQKFQVVATGDPRWIGLRALSNNKYVTAENAGAGFLLANRTSVAWWESFEWMRRPDATVVLKARANLKVVRADPNLANPPQLIANSKVGGTAERFFLTVH